MMEGLCTMQGCTPESVAKDAGKIFENRITDMSSS
jgi:hypothetical protein